VDELLECEWSVILTPLPNSVAVQVTLQNHSQRLQPGYWWTNIAVPAQQGTRLFYHPGPVLHHGCDMGMAYEQWPHLNGNDWQYWQNHSGIISAYCPEYGSDVFGYAPPGEGWAMVHHADRRFCRGRKLWSVGSGHDADVWMDRVGDPSAESYCEIQSGRLPTQLEADLLKPGKRLTWVEFFTTICCPNKTDAASAFTEFEHSAAATLEKQEADSWRVTQAEVLVEEDPRLALSRKVVLSPGALTAREIHEATRQGWVGGASWVRLLENVPADEWRDLALGAARLDLNREPGATALLAPLARRDDECGGLASFLMGHREYERGQREAAIEHLQQAVVRLPGNPDARRWLHQAFLETNRLSAARDLWRTSLDSTSLGLASDASSVKQPAGLTGALAASDVARFARAQIAFLERRWQDSRLELERPMPCIAEGTAGPWLLRKEIELAEALEKYAAGRFEEAQGHLLDGCRFMPQFGVGRYETTGNLDLLFYRWLLASLAGARFQAAALASHILRFRPYAGSVEAAYVLRLALALGDPASGTLTATVASWDADAEPLWRDLLPLRHALHQGTPAAWETLQHHLLYRYRAQFELTLARNAEQQL
jgi:tetratricopeptide (TPR) repeat protein